MATISRPLKTAGNTTYTAEKNAGATKIKAAEVDADLNTVYAEINGALDNANIKAAAGIATSKIAQDSGLINAHISGSAGILGTKLAVGASINNQQRGAAVSGGIDVGAVETTLATATITTRGGRVFLNPSIAYRLVPLAPGPDQFIVRFRRGGTQVMIRTYALDTMTTVATLLGPTPCWDEQPAAGTYVYTFTVETGSANLKLRVSPYGGTNFVGELIATEGT